MIDDSIYAAAGREAAFLRLAAAWHARCLQDPMVRHAFERPGLHPHHVERVAAYWVQALGGPATYSGTFGDHTGVQRMHAGNGAHPGMDRHAVHCFLLAMDDADIPADHHLRRLCESGSPG
ncbi:oxidoreductase [Nocardia brasiliensis]|uniref:globin domain-containing protein n=1 Tax=Nocardia brasiliensis TaxID=37326 RepID=UPI003D94F667